MYNPDTYSFYDTYLHTLQTDARRLIEVTRAGVRLPSDIDAVIAEMAAQPGGRLGCAARCVQLRKPGDDCCTRWSGIGCRISCPRGSPLPAVH